MNESLDQCCWKNLSCKLTLFFHEHWTLKDEGIWLKIKINALLFFKNPYLMQKHMTLLYCSHQNFLRLGAVSFWTFVKMFLKMVSSEVKWLHSRSFRQNFSGYIILQMVQIQDIKNSMVQIWNDINNLFTNN